MPDQTKLADQQIRGEAAAALLENPLFIDAFEAVETDILNAWKTSNGDQDKHRERLYLMQRLNLNLKQYYVTHVANGKAAAKQLTELKDPSKIIGFGKRS